VAVYGRLALVDPAHTDGLAPIAIVGIGLTVMLMALDTLVHPVELIDTVKVPVYVAGAAAPGTISVIGLAGSTALITLIKPAASAAAL